MGAVIAGGTNTVSDASADRVERPGRGEWDVVAELLAVDPMRPVRYGHIYRLLRDFDRESRILEVGCGEGSGFRYARRLGFERLAGVEVSSERAAVARSAAPGVPVEVIEDGEELPFGDETFDVVVSAGVIEHTRDPVHFSREISRVLTAGGAAVISSDCWIWKLLQLTGAYRSVQPVDNALSTPAWLSIFARTGFDVRGYDGFGMEGATGRCVVLLLTENAVVAYVRRQLQRMSSDTRPKTAPGSSAPAGASRDLGDELAVFLKESQAPPRIGRSISNLVRSQVLDENIFLLRKRPRA